MHCIYEKCPNEASVQLFVSNPEDEQNLSNPNYYCDEHAELIRKTRIVNKEVKIDSEYKIGSLATEDSVFKDTPQDLKPENSQE